MDLTPEQRAWIRRCRRLGIDLTAGTERDFLEQFHAAATECGCIVGRDERATHVLEAMDELDDALCNGGAVCSETDSRQFQRAARSRRRRRRSQDEGDEEFHHLDFRVGHEEHGPVLPHPEQSSCAAGGPEETRLHGEGSHPLPTRQGEKARHRRRYTFKEVTTRVSHGRGGTRFADGPPR